VLARREPFYEASLRLWTLAERGELRALVSVISFNNLYYIVRKLEGRAAADRAVRLVRATFVPVALDEQLLDQATQMRPLESAATLAWASQAGVAATGTASETRRFATVAR